MECHDAAIIAKLAEYLQDVDLHVVFPKRKNSHEE